MTRNIGASARARLKNYADEHKEEFNLTLTHYGLERLLYRLSVSRHANTFLRKGALLFSLWYQHPHRPTRDADLLAFGPSDVESLVAIFREICEVGVDDGVKFVTDQIKGAEIRKTAGYGGVRIDVPAELDGARMSLQLTLASAMRSPLGRRMCSIRCCCKTWLPRSCARTRSTRSSPRSCTRYACSGW